MSEIAEFFFLKVYQYGYQISIKFYAEFKYAIKSAIKGLRKYQHQKISFQEFKKFNFSGSRH